jgi:hypothetical protein
MMTQASTSKKKLSPLTKPSEFLFHELSFPVLPGNR